MPFGGADGSVVLQVFFAELVVVVPRFAGQDDGTGVHSMFEGIPGGAELPSPVLGPRDLAPLRRAACARGDEAASMPITDWSVDISCSSAFKIEGELAEAGDAEAGDRRYVLEGMGENFCWQFGERGVWTPLAGQRDLERITIRSRPPSDGDGDPTRG